MNNIILQNFRNITNSVPIELKPLTFLVGQNGAGKSSFLRLFPLLKQSLNEPKRGPLLWYTENGVDFGDFKTTVMNDETTIGIGFEINSKRTSKDNAMVSVFMRIEPEKKDIQYEHVSFLEIKYKDVIISISFDATGADVYVNNHKKERFNSIANSYGLFPYLYSRNREENDKMTKEVDDILYQKKPDEYRGLYNTLFMSYVEFEGIMEGIETTYDIKTLFSKIVCLNLSEIMNSIQMTLSEEMRYLTYIGPFRSSPQRYYRLQNKSTRMIDMYGSNMAAYVKEMSEEQLEELNNKLLPQYGFELDYESDFGQVSLFIKKGDKKTNLIDNGYGYSQLMPILLAINEFNERRIYDSTITSFLCMEQPELHLHPKIQSVLGVSLANAANKQSKNKTAHKCILVETHSRQIIESVGKAVYNKQLKREDVAVYLFEQGEDNKAVIRKTEFDEEGYLIDWPIGFLD